MHSVKETLNHGLSLSEIEWGDLKRETTKHGPSLMEVEWGGKMMANHAMSECMLSEVDWGADHDEEPKDFFTKL